MIEDKDDMELFIEFILDLAEDEFDNFVGNVTMKYFFRHGGCLEFAKVLLYFIPNSRIYYSQTEEHFSIFFQGYLYDAIEKRNNFSDYKEVSLEYISKYENHYGRDILFEGKSVHLALIQEIKACSGDYINNLINKINHKDFIGKLNPKE